MEKYLENLVGISGKILFLILRSSRLAGYWKKKKEQIFGSNHVQISFIEQSNYPPSSIYLYVLFERLEFVQD